MSQAQPESLPQSHLQLYSDVQIQLAQLGFELFCLSRTAKDLKKTYCRQATYIVAVDDVGLVWFHSDKLVKIPPGFKQVEAKIFFIGVLISPPRAG